MAYAHALETYSRECEYKRGGLNLYLKSVLQDKTRERWVPLQFEGARHAVPLPGRLAIVQTRN